MQPSISPHAKEFVPGTIEVIDPATGKRKKVSHLYKTELCSSFMETGACQYGAACLFAHGTSDLRKPKSHPKYKTKLCTSFSSSGTCAFGDACVFIHDAASQKRPAKTSKKTKAISSVDSPKTSKKLITALSAPKEIDSSDSSVSPEEGRKLSHHASAEIEKESSTLEFRRHRKSGSLELRFSASGPLPSSFVRSTSLERGRKIVLVSDDAPISPRSPWKFVFSPSDQVLSEPVKASDPESRAIQPRKMLKAAVSTEETEFEQLSKKFSKLLDPPKPFFDFATSTESKEPASSKATTPKTGGGLLDVSRFGPRLFMPPGNKTM